jgi:hypothetical protein
VAETSMERRIVDGSRSGVVVWIGIGAIGAALVILSLRLGSSGSGEMPIAGGVVLIVASLASLRPQKRASPYSRATGYSRGATVRIAILSAALVGYSMILGRLGFLPATLCLSALLAATPPHITRLRRIQIFLVGACLTVGIYYIFAQVFSVVLPPGWLPHGFLQ